MLTGLVIRPMFAFLMTCLPGRAQHGRFVRMKAKAAGREPTRSARVRDQIGSVAIPARRGLNSRRRFIIVWIGQRDFWRNRKAGELA